jgi:dolichol-phosphate hexosyltransferase
MELERSTKQLISIIIPALNEQEGIGPTIKSIPSEELNRSGYSVEIIVVDGKSFDNTRDVAESLHAKVIVEDITGYGRAYKTGFSAARGDIIVTTDADGSYPLDKIPFYLQELDQKGLDFITVNRLSGLHKDSMSFVHFVGNKILGLTLKMLYSLDIRDSQSGMWIMRREFIERIELCSDDMSLSEEIKIIAFKLFKSLEVDGEYKERFGRAKLSTFSHGWDNFKYLFYFRSKLNFALRSAVYPITK